MRAALVPVLLVLVTATTALTFAQGSDVRTGATAVRDDWKTDAPGVRRLIKPSDIPAPVPGPDAEGSVGRSAKVVDAPNGASPKVPEGFVVQVFASGFKQPRTLRVAPNGDVFLSESGTGRVLVFRASEASGGSAKPQVFAENLDRPYGIAFLPPDNPQYIYVAAANQVVRYPYHSGAIKAGGPAEVVVANIPTKRHWTRETTPSFAHHAAAELPAFTQGGIRARVIAGEAMGVRAPVRTHSPLFYMHCELADGARAELPAQYPERAAYIAAGEIEVDGQRFTEGRMLIFQPARPVLLAAAGPAVVMLIGGEPVGERFIEWNFVSSSKERIAQAKADWQAGRMKLPDLDNGESIPLPSGPEAAPNPMS